MLRRRLGLSQVELATLLGVSNVTVNRWEHDRALPEPATLARLARAEHEGIAALRAPAARKGNLPVPPAAILGRAADLAMLQTLLASERLVTLTGPGGVGKTRLAVEAAHALADRFPDGVWFIDLAALTDGHEVEHAVARVIGVRDAGRRPLTERLVADLRERTRLLLLDNCEHLLPACAAFARAFLAEPGASRLLATSRAPLGVSSEHVMAVGPLAPADAVALFVQRARSRGVTLALDPPDARCVAELCRRLDRLPLAIELAAARTHVLSVAQIAERLDRRFDLLRTDRAESPRQQALDLAIAWSYDLLEPPEAALFDRLGVFAGSFDLAAVEAVSGSEDALDLLDRLARQSLITVERDARSPAARYRLLESIAAFARGRLAASGETETVTQRAVEYYAALARSAAERLRGPDQAAQLALLDLEIDNILAALEWTCVSGEPEQAVALAASLAPYWQRRGLFTEGSDWLGRALALEPVTPSAERARALTGFATLATPGGRFAEAERALADAIALARAAGDPAAEAQAHDTAGILARGRGELERAQTSHEAAFALWTALGDRRGAAGSRSNLGLLANIRGEHAAAERCYLEAWSLIHGAGDPATEAAVLANLGEVAARAGRPRDAADYYERALAIVRELGDPIRIAILVGNAAEVKLVLGEVAEAAALAAEAVAQFRALDDKIQLAGALYIQGVILAATQRRGMALAILREALALYHLLGNWVDAAQTVEAIAGLFVAAGEGMLPARWLGGAEAIRERDGVDPYPLFDYAGTVAGLRSLLNEATFAACWAAGRRLSPEQLVSDALHRGRLEDLAPPDRAPAPASPPKLTPRQREVLERVAAGASTREIAAELSISQRSVERHLTAIYEALGVDRRSAAVAAAAASGLLGSRAVTSSPGAA